MLGYDPDTCYSENELAVDICIAIAKTIEVGRSVIISVPNKRNYVVITKDNINMILPTIDMVGNVNFAEEGYADISILKANLSDFFQNLSSDCEVDHGPLIHIRAGIENS